MEYGYARVSTKEQNERRQFAALQEFGIEKGRIYVDKQSGKNFERSEYQRLLGRLRQGDTLIIQSIDRLGRNYEEILEQWRIITKKKQVSIVVLDMLLLDTRQRKDLTGTQAHGTSTGIRATEKNGNREKSPPETPPGSWESHIGLSCSVLMRVRMDKEVQFGIQIEICQISYFYEKKYIT